MTSRQNAAKLLKNWRRKLMAVKTVTIKLIKSPTGRLKKHKACVAGLGLRRIGDEVKVEDTASVRGMIDKIDYLIKVGGGN
ncbi:MAG TPA: 50S ribosomal protein L30 [Gammaproteobacteria bacterium]|nr:50S ribosomal protein L30 [Gammaproteobacteria bacterium]HCP50192.1 50S ribosomal protein L30 [Gammaproteobacteria bacterium]